jgi:hypothetical protein
MATTSPEGYYMDNYKKILFLLQWKKGVKIVMPHTKFIKYCLGASVTWLSFSFGCFLLIRAIAPHGFF